MNQHIYNIALVIHVVGITIMAGTTFIDLMIFRYFWKTFPDNKTGSFVVENILYRLQRFMGIGMLIIILSGVMMMVYLHQVWGQQIWFRIKIGILVLIIINGLGFRRRLGSKLKKLLSEGTAGNNFNEKLSALKKNITTVHAFQILFFLIIFILSIFKFN